MSSKSDQESFAAEAETETETETETEAAGKLDDVSASQAGAHDAADSDIPVTLVESAEPAAADPIAVLQAEVARWKDLALRSQAELDNFRKRMAREKADAIRFGNAALLESLLPAVDNFRFGLEAARREAGPSVVVDGMSMVYKQLNDLLEEFGVQEVVAEGVPFDPNLHDAIREEASNEVREGHVISVVRRGFRLHDRLLRPANVIVSRGPATPEADRESHPQAANAQAPSSTD